jgi:iron complex outermembrane receptor protein
MEEEIMGSCQFKSRQLKSRLTAITGLSLAWIWVCQSPACAQEAPPSSGGQALPQGTESQRDIVVTAQHRTQRLQDVSIAVSALQGEALKNYSVNDASDLVRAIPQLKMNAFSSAMVVFNIRGVAQNDYGDQQEPPIAVYQDDSYSSSINTASFPTFDLQRVEVLRGPQGTLFGRNATGGAIQFVSNQPTKEFGGYGSVTVGSFGQLITEAAVSGSLADNLQVRLAGSRNRDKGYFSNINGGPRLGANNHWALRGIIAWQPTSNLDVNLTLRYMRAPHERMAGMYSLVATCPNDQYQGEYLDANTTCPFWESTGFATPGSTATGLTNDAINPQRGGDPWKLYQTGPNYSNREIFGSTLKLNWHTGPFEIVSITDFQKSKKDYLETKYPDLGEVFMSNSRLTQVSQELRAAVKLGRNQLTFGAYGMIIDGDYESKYATPFIDYDPLAIFSQKTKSFAFFAQDEFSLTDQLSFTAGLRYWKDYRKGSYASSEASTGVSLVYNPSQIAYYSFGVLQPSTGLTATPADADTSFDGVTARAAIQYKPNRDILLYASYNRGSKSGGFTFPSSTPLPGSEIATLNGIAYKPETLDDFELGAKFTLPLNTTLNLAAYHYIYKDYQAFVQDGPIQAVRNLRALATGLEVELATRPLPGLSVSLNGAFERSRVRHVVLPDAVTIVNDHSLPQAPSFSGTATARYEWNLAGGKAAIQGDMLHNSSFCFSVMCAPDEKEPGYEVYNARISFGDIDDRWELAAFVKNITKTQYRVYALDVSLYDGSVLGTYAAPRTFGVSATYRFGAQ